MLPFIILNKLIIMISNEDQEDINNDQEQQKEQNNDDITENKPIEKISNISKPTINNVSVNKTYSINNNTSFYENFDIAQLTYSIMKNYSQLKISKDENFMERMKFDIYKRQIKEERVNKLVEQNKIRIEEEERIKAFNRLIEDANRRIEAQENLELMKNKLEEDLTKPPDKKYTQKEWEDIYKERFIAFLEEVNRKNQERIKEKREIERKEEQEEIELCKVKKASQKEIDDASKRLYEEALKRKAKRNENLRVNYDNSPSKYKMNVNSGAYTFMSDNEEDGHNTNQNNATSNKAVPKKKKINVTDYNNRRFENSNTKNNIQKKKVKAHMNYSTKKYVNQYLDEGIDDSLLNKKALTSVTSTVNYKTEGNNNQSFHTKNLDQVALNRLQRNEYIEQLNPRMIRESEASKIVDQFFTKNLKK